MAKAPFTQAQHSVLTHFAIRPLLVVLLSISSIMSLRALAELSSRYFQVPTLLPVPIRVHKLLLRRGNIHPNLFRNSGPKFDMEANQPFQQDNLMKTPPCVAAPKSDRGRLSTSQSFETTRTLVNLRVLTMSSTEILVAAHLGHSAKCRFSAHKLLLYRYSTSLAGPVSMGASISPCLLYTSPSPRDQA